ncbi:hypothetical protein MNBD_GAMMA12-1677 [hydrothermal vent metagenome]|uniref:WGR domain-containing protein n=1 Tax=hydrothermal vent metagenome TaxID=652676 RepID=A0A3B0YDJ4_9ZZZZ
MPRYEYDDGTSPKFWEINIINDTYEVRCGKIGTKGQVSVKNFSSDQEAQLAADKIAAAKVKKGYGLVGKSSPSPVDPIDELVRSIQIDPDNIEAWQVYSDYLQTQNDPHGELIALGIAIEKASETSETREKVEQVQVRFDQIWAENKFACLGEVAEFISDEESFILKWRYGYLLDVHVTYQDKLTFFKKRVLLGTLFDISVGQFIQSLTFGFSGNSINNVVDFSACFDEFPSGVQRESVKHLKIGELYSKEYEFSWSFIGFVNKVFSLFPNLETLLVSGLWIEFGELKHHKLKTLNVLTGCLSPTGIKSIANAMLPALESLTVWFGRELVSDEGVCKALEPLLQGNGYASLKHLGLMNAEVEDEILQALVKAPIMKQLISLNLSMGTMTDNGAQVLLENREVFQHLRSINLSDNHLSKDMSVRLKKMFLGIINTDNQRAFEIDEDGNIETYVSAGE